MKNVMVDIETMDVSAKAAIVSIGAVRFSENGVGRAHDRFSYTIDLDSNLAVGRTMNASTVMWWMRQDDDARRAIYDGVNQVNLKFALNEFNTFLKRVKGSLVWGNGADFDNTIIISAMADCGIEPGWKFRDNRCFRTLKHLYPDTEPERQGVRHNALDDAVHQAEWAVNIFRCRR